MTAIPKTREGCPECRGTAWGALCILAICLAAHGAVPASASDERANGLLYKVSEGVSLSLSDVVEDLKSARIIFVGELHDQMAHHEAQLQIIKALHGTGEPLAVGLEMFQAEHQSMLDRWVAGSVSAEEFMSVYRENWGFPWEYYSDIFRHARDGGIPLIGLNVPKEITRQVARHGFASLSVEQLEKLPPVTCRVDQEYETFIRQALGEHAHAGKSFTHFCEAQLLWDAGMAHNLLRFMERHPEYRVVVLAGSGHSWKRGIPEQIQLWRRIPYRVILPQIPGRVEPAAFSAEDADYLWLTS